MDRFFVTFDLGTSSVKATLVEARRGVARVETQAYPLFTDAAGRAEQNAADWWRAFCDASRRLLGGVDAACVKAVCVSGQMMVCLPVAGGEALLPAMTWADSRAVQESEALARAFPDGEYYQKVGMRPTPNYTLPKLMYVKRTRPEVYNRAERFLSAKDYINYRLTGRAATDGEDAAFTQALALAGEDWDEALLRAAGIAREKLPPILPCGTVLGGVQAQAAREAGLPEGLPVVLGLGDGGAATLGSGTLHRGDAYTSLGTSSWVCAVTNQPTPDAAQTLSKVRYLGGYRDSGTMQSGGYSFSWLQSALALPYEEMTARALQTPAGADGLLFLPQLMGERAPFWDERLRAAFIGLTASMGAGQMCRAVAEGVAMQLGMILHLIQSANAPLAISAMRLVGGGANSPLWRQVLADVYGLPVLTTDASAHAGALGMAVIAGKAVGVFSSYDEVLAFHHHPAVTPPNPGNATVYKNLAEIFRDARQALTAIDHRLAAQKG